MRRWMGRFALGLAAVTLVAACGGDDDTTIDVPGGGEINVSDDLPDDFPDDFPIYDGADFQGSVQSTESGAEGLAATWETDDDLDDVVAFYEGEFEEGPWRSGATTNAGGVSSFVVTNDDDENAGGFVTLTEADGKVQIVALVAESDSAIGGGGDDATSESGDEGEATDEDTPEASDGDDGSGDEETSQELPEAAELPDGFPEDKFPVADDARVTSASSLSSGGQSTYFVEIYVEGSASDVADEYKAAMTSAGWTETLTSSSDGAFFLSYGNEAGTETAIVNVQDSETDGYALVSGTVSVPD